jgi:putative endonuclease
MRRNGKSQSRNGRHADEVSIFWNNQLPMKKMYVYIMSNYTRTTFYVGVTNNLERRVTEHKRLKGSVFTSKYKLIDLVYYEEIFGTIEAITREKQIKNRPRQWKLDLIKQLNPEMPDLAKQWGSKDADLGQHDGGIRLRLFSEELK